MEITLEEAFKKVCILVKDFEKNLQQYMSPDYSEAQVRLDYIDKFFSALGWDVNHQWQKNPYEQEVKVEKNVKDGTAKKRADYAFYLAPNYRDPVFYAEAKKPSVKILDNPNIYFQVVRYGWNSNTPIGLVTDFEELHVIDCRHKPDIGNILDKSVQKFNFSQYKDINEFAKIYWLFSREAVSQDSLNKYSESLLKPRGKAIPASLFKGGYASIDETFLEDIDQIRLALANALVKDGLSLSSIELTEATQKIIDRLVFIRFLEDKLIEQEHLINSFSSWADFIRCSRVMDGKYNGIVFKKGIVDKIVAGDNLEHEFSRICNDICHLNSPYDFNSIPIHILGSIYERFLGKLVVASKTGATIELKPEVRRSGGVYYTPEHIVRHIVSKTVGEAVNGKTPKQIKSMKFADIACGSGSFLIGVFDYLISYHNNFYQNNEKQAKQDGCIFRDNKWIMPLKIRQEILVNNIFGVDIDSQAAEITQVSLFLKLLEDETTASAQQMTLELSGTLLPNLSANIISGNSLIGTDILFENILKEEDLLKVNPMDYHYAFKDIMDNGGFDCLVGNPPYDVIEKERKMDFLPHFALHQYQKNKARYSAAKGGKLNLFRFFVVKNIELTKDKGRYGFIIPLSLLADKSCASARKYLLDWSQNLESDCFPQKDNAKKRVFKDAKLSTVVITGSKHKHKKDGNKKITVRTYPWGSLRDAHKKSQMKLEDLALLDKKSLPIPLLDDLDWGIVTEIYKRENVIRLGDLSDVHVRRGEINQTIYKEYISLDPNDNKMIKGAEVGRYLLNEKMSQGIFQWFNEAKYLQENREKSIISNRRIAMQRITGVDEKYRVVACLAKKNTYFADSTNSLHLSSGSKYKLEFFLAILNSSLYQWRFKLTSTNNNVGTNELESLPFPNIDFKNNKSASQYNHIVDLTERIIKLKKELLNLKADAEKNLKRRLIDNFSKQIDQIIYSLFGIKEQAQISRIEKVTE